MVTDSEDFARLSLLIQRALDADVLGDVEGAALLRATEAARQSLLAGDMEAGRQHIERVAPFLEALMRTDALYPTNGNAALETARRLLAGDAD